MTSQIELEQQMHSLSWYHTINLGNGLVTPGAYDHAPYLFNYGIPESLHGRRCLDVGPASGFFSLEMERRGGCVTAIELPSWKDHDFGPRYIADLEPEMAERYLHEPFRFARAVCNSSIELKNMTIYQITPETVGMFDLVFCGSVLLHLTDPIRALWNLQRVTKGAAIIATTIHQDRVNESIASFVGFERGDGWWYPTRKTLEQMIFSAGFQGWELFSEFQLDYANRQAGPYHAVMIAWNTSLRPEWLPPPIQREVSSPAHLPLPVNNIKPLVDSSISDQHENELAQMQVKVSILEQERDQWRSLAQGYERGKIMRLLKWMHQRLHR